MHNKKKDLGRVLTSRTKHKYNKIARVDIRSRMADAVIRGDIDRLDIMKPAESIRYRIYHGRNDWFENTRFGEHNSRRIKHSVFVRMLDRFTGRKFDDFLSYIHKVIPSHDIDYVMRWVVHEFGLNPHHYLHRMLDEKDYKYRIGSNGIIELNPKYRTIAQIVEARKSKQNKDNTAVLYVSEFHAYIKHNDKWWTASLAGEDEFKRIVGSHCGPWLADWTSILWLCDATGFRPVGSGLSWLVAYDDGNKKHWFGDDRYSHKYVKSMKPANTDDIRNIHKRLSSLS